MKPRDMSIQGVSEVDLEAQLEPTQINPIPEEKIGSLSSIVVPIHAATGLGGIKRKNGRPRTINRKPTSDELIYHAEMIKQREMFIEADTLVRATKGRQDTLETLQKVKEEVAREAAALQFTRREEEKYGRDASAVSAKRIAALNHVAQLELQIKELGIASIDLKGEQFQRVFLFFLETIRESAQEVFSEEQVNVLFNRLESKLENWEERAQDLIR